MRKRVLPFIILIFGMYFVAIPRAVSGDSQRGQEGSEKQARKEVREPGLILETGARMAACDVLTFTPDGRSLLATGDDKVVRVWECTPAGLDPSSVRVLRWATYRDRRGSIYALALSSTGQSVVVGGFGLRRSNLAVIDRQSGVIQHAAVPPLNATIWAVAFSPRDDQVAFGADDGSVWLWNLHGRPGHNLQRLGRHAGKGFNYVRLVTFLGDGQVLSVAANGQVVKWNVNQVHAAPVELFRFQKTGNLFRAAIDPRHHWIAVAGQQTQGKSAQVVEVRSLDGTRSKILTLPQSAGKTYPRCLAFDAQGQRLAVGTYSIPATARFYKITHGDVFLYDLAEKHPRPAPGPNKLSWYPEALAFHPNGRRLAVAGGDNQEVTLWDLRQPDRAVSLIRSPGSCLWGVALSPDGRYLGYQESRRRNPPGPNSWGRGPWKVFDLFRRQWADPDRFQPVRPRASAGGWRVEPSPRNGYIWYVVGPNQRRYPLPIDPDRDHMPLCYTFLRASSGKVRLAVGHYWGISLFEMTHRGPRLLQLFSGHQGAVMSVAVSADNQTLVSASRDQTIAGWSLASWPSQPALGARFVSRLGKLYVEAVDPGSPAWEAGLSKGDVIVLFAFARNQFLYDPNHLAPKAIRAECNRIGTVEEALRRLRRPEPGKEFYFAWQHPGETRVYQNLTTVRQRPVWVFFPTRGNDWVLWRWRDYYYDTSTNGDALIGWQISADVDTRPAFYEARNFQDRFHRPDKVAEMVRQTRTAPERVLMPDIQPPRLDLQVNDQGARVAVTMRVTPRGPRDFHRPDRLLLWIEDYLYREWDARSWRRADGVYWHTELIPKTSLRSGSNRLILQCYNRAGGCGRVQQQVTRATPPVAPALHVLLVGVVDYTRVTLPQGLHFGDLPGVKVDVERLEDVFLNQKNRLFRQLPSKSLLDREATRSAILGRLEAIRKRARPDDLLIFFLDGHGLAQDLRVQGSGLQKKSFVFVCPGYDYRRPADTGITADDLYKSLMKIPCRKLVLISACHSGDATANVLRDLTQDGVGPIVLSACSYQESAFILDVDGSLFTQAIAEAWDEKFAEADSLVKDGQLDTRELAVYVKRRVPRLLAKLKQENPEDFKKQKLLGATQHPDNFPLLTHMERFALFQKGDKVTR